MATQFMTPDTADTQFKDDGAITRQRYRFSASVTGAGDWVILPPEIGDAVVSVAPSSGTARIEYTLSSVADVEAGTAVARNWPDGDVAGYTDSLISNSVTAIRCVSTAATDFVVTA